MEPILNELANCCSEGIDTDDVGAEVLDVDVVAEVPDADGAARTDWPGVAVVCEFCVMFDAANLSPHKLHTNALSGNS